MSDHYCCKKCGLRYDVCDCASQSAPAPKNKPPAQPAPTYSAEDNHYFEMTKRYAQVAAANLEEARLFAGHINNAALRAVANSWLAEVTK